MFSKVEFKGGLNQFENKVSEKWNQATGHNLTSVIRRLENLFTARLKAPAANKKVFDDRLDQSYSRNAPALKTIPNINHNIPVRTRRAETASAMINDLNAPTHIVDARPGLTPMDLASTIFVAGFLAGVIFGLLFRLPH